jgi:isopenicillin-N N-acyltransferase-like protein
MIGSAVRRAVAGRAGVVRYKYPRGGQFLKESAIMSVPEIRVSGSPYEIGFGHGRQAGDRVRRSIEFYTAYFKEMANVSWDEVRGISREFRPNIENRFPELFEELRGLAEGAELPLEDILALNVRTEIAFGLQITQATDGCTAMYWRPRAAAGDVFLAQNWDWKEAQADALVALDAAPSGKPRFQTMTEAGILAKIGLNEHGVGCCLNAISATGLDATRLPVHLALRLILNFKSAARAAEFLETEEPCASAAHILVADGETATGLEFSSTDVQKLLPDTNDCIFHSNHYVLDHHKPDGSKIVDVGPTDSPFRLKRISEITHTLSPTVPSIQSAFADRDNYPGSICRQTQGDVESTTLFNIVMNLSSPKAHVIIGKPDQPHPTQQLQFVF